MIDRMHLRIAVYKAIIVLAPSYLVAYLTDKMVFVVPTLAAAGFFAATLHFNTGQATQRVDEDADADGTSVIIEAIDGSS